jgi:hypothetical protein
LAELLFWRNLITAHQGAGVDEIDDRIAELNMLRKTGSSRAGKSSEEGAVETRRSFRSGAGPEEMIAVRRDGSELWSCIALSVTGSVGSGDGVIAVVNHTGLIDFY